MYVCVCVSECAQWLNGVWLFSDSVDSNPPGSSMHGIFQARNSREGCHFLFQGVLNPEIQAASPALAGELFTTVPLGNT